MADPQSAQYGSWAERQTPQQVLWEKRVSQNEPEALDAVMRMFSASGPLQTNLHNTESNLKHAQNLMNKGEYIPPRNSQISLDVYNTVKNKYTNLFVATATGVNQHNTNFLPAGAKPTPGLVQSPAAKFAHAFQPISTFIGTTLFTQPGMAQSNLHQGICPSVGKALERINPRFKQDIMSVQSALKLDELSHLPSQIMGSVRHVTSAVNKLLAAPAHIIYDLFKGAIGAVQKMSALVSGVFKNLQHLALKAVGLVAGALQGITQGIITNIMGAVGGLANSIQSMMGAFSGMNLLSSFSTSLLGKLGSGDLSSMVSKLGGLGGLGGMMGNLGGLGGMMGNLGGMGGMMGNLGGMGGMMGNVSGMAGKLGGLGNLSGGLGNISGMAGKLGGAGGGLMSGLGGITSKLGGIDLKNPMDVSKLFHDPRLGSLRGFTLNSAMDMKNKLIPPSIGGNMEKVLHDKVSSFGMMGNSAPNFAKSMDSIKSGVLSSVLRNFSTQAGILNHIFSGQDPQPINSVVGNSLAEGYDGTKYSTDVSKNVTRQYPPNFIIPHQS